MSGTKNKSGGPRPGNPNGTRGQYDRTRAKKSGPLKQNISLRREYAQELRILLRNRQSLGSDIDEDRLVESLIHEKWLEYDQSIQASVEQMEEFIT